MGVSVGSAEIEAEAEYLATARAVLGRMRDEVLSTETPEFVSGTDEVWFNNMYRIARAQRGADLVDLPDVPLFFGRLDYEPGTIHDREPSEGADLVYVGRRHVRDDEGTPLVVDWRAPVSMPFYRATREDPQGVHRRRRYGFSDAAQLTAYEDEHLVEHSGGATADRPSALLSAEIERPRSGPMRDIVATIQPEQDELVRAPLQPSLCVQGAPGTGKTAVGLHRLAYLLYTEPSRLTGGVTVVGPNRSFLAYTRHVLPALGEVSVLQKTIDELIDRPVTGTDGPDTARLKGDARMAEVLRRALWSHIGEPSDDFVYVHGATRYRVARGRVAQTVADLRGGARYGPGRDGVAQRLAHLVLTQMERRGASPDDRELSAVARSKPVRQLLDAVWPKLTPEQVLFRLLSDAEYLAAVADGLVDPDEQATLLWPRPYRSAKSARWSAADAVLLDELAGLIDRTPSLSHVMVDEAQDLSPMQCRARMARTPISGVTPRVRIEAACARRGKDAVVADCIALLRGKTDRELLSSLVGEEAIRYFDGREHQDLYWFRVWALRGLLWAWDPRAEKYVCAALSDEAWRVREMAAKIVARHRVGNAVDAVAERRDDPVPRVRAAAERALIRLTAAGA